MRKPITLLAAIALSLGGVLVPAVATAAPQAPTIQRAWVAVDAGRVGLLDAGDVLKLRFTRGVIFDDITSTGLLVTGANGVTMRLDEESAPYGGYFTAKQNVVTIRVNLIPEEYPVTPLEYPLTVSDTFHIVAKAADHTEVSVPGSRDVLID